ncbi:MAG: hypothetical protein V1908_02890 [Candidatus Peregrinibacteria bacterium]
MAAEIQIVVPEEIKEKNLRTLAAARREIGLVFNLGEVVENICQQLAWEAISRRELFSAADFLMHARAQARLNFGDTSGYEEQLTTIQRELSNS